MRSVHHDVHLRGGIAPTYELLREGHTPRQLTRAVRRGEVLRVRHGHYACPELAVPQLEAYRVGGRLTGIAGARAHRMWVPRSALVDIQVTRDARALRTRTDPTKRLTSNPDRVARISWTDERRPGTRSLAGPVDCLRVVIRTCSARDAFAVVESALHRGIVTENEWTRLLASLCDAGPLAAAAGLSESGGESLLLFDLTGHGYVLRQQVEIAGLGRVDFILGARLILEVDGAEFHTDRDAFEEDRRRDAVASALGFRVLRFSHAQVERRDPLVLEAIRAAVERGDRFGHGGAPGTK